MAEESLPFYTLLVPVMMAARFDPVVTAATCMCSAPVSHDHRRVRHTVICRQRGWHPSPTASGGSPYWLPAGCCASPALRQNVRNKSWWPTSGMRTVPFLGWRKSDQMLEFTLTRKIVLGDLRRAFAVMICGWPC